MDICHLQKCVCVCVCVSDLFTISRSRMRGVCFLPPLVSQPPLHTHTHTYTLPTGWQQRVSLHQRALSVMSLPGQTLVSKCTEKHKMRQFCLSIAPQIRLISPHHFNISITSSFPFALNLIFTITSHPDILSSISTRSLIVKPKISCARWSSLDFTPKYFESERLPLSD